MTTNGRVLFSILCSSLLFLFVCSFFGSLSTSLSSHHGNQVPNSSLTVWAHHGDPLSVDDLIVFRKAFTSNQLMYDLPEDILRPFRDEVYRR